MFSLSAEIHDSRDDQIYIFRWKQSLVGPQHQTAVKGARPWTWTDGWWVRGTRAVWSEIYGWITCEYIESMHE